MTTKRRLIICCFACLLGVLLAVTPTWAGETDCDNNGIPDQNELAGNDCDGDGVLDVCQIGELVTMLEIDGFNSSDLIDDQVSLDIDGNVAVIGEPKYRNFPNPENGRVLIYEYSIATGWLLKQEVLGPSFEEAVNSFGEQVSVSGNRIAITMPKRSESNRRQGAVFIYERIDGSWQLVDTIISPFRDVHFGQRIDLLGNRLFAYMEDYFQNGTVYTKPRLVIYHNAGNAWLIEQVVHDGSTEWRPRLEANDRAYSLVGNQIVTAERRSLLRNTIAFGGSGVIIQYFRTGDNLSFFKWWKGRWLPESLVITWNSNIGGSVGFTALSVNGPTLLAAFTGSSVSIVFTLDGSWSGVDGVGTLFDWISPVGEGFFAGAQSIGDSTVYDVQLVGSDASSVEIPELAMELGRGVRSGNWWVYEASPASAGAIRIKAVLADCDGDGELDHCEIAGGASDVDGNGIPDSCERDCNADGIPDAAQLTLGDCNANQILDVCDIDSSDPDGDQVVWGDCNADGVPDDCQADCNFNGVPDDCDLDPADPDGDEFVSQDCNDNSVPDECEQRVTLVQTETISPPDDITGLTFAASLAATDEKLIVGAPALDPQSGISGKVFVYQASSGYWLFDAQLAVSQIDMNEYYGEKVAVSDQHAFVGGRRGSNAVIFIFLNVDGTWVLSQEIVLVDDSALDYGFSVNGNRLVVRTNRESFSRVFELDNGSWSEISQISHSNHGSFDKQIFVEGDTVAYRISSTGVKLYQFDGQDWSFFAASDSHPTPSQQFPTITAFSQSTVALGRPGLAEELLVAPLALNLTGGVEISRFYGENAFPEAYIYGPDALSPAERHYFGASMSFLDDSDRIVIGAPFLNARQGGIFLYERFGAKWELRQEIHSPLDGQPLHFGSHMVVSGDYLFVSATADYLTPEATDNDAIVVYNINRDVDANGIFDGCQTDCDEDLIPDTWQLANANIDSFVAALFDGGPACVWDMNGDGALNGRDIAGFVAQLTMVP